MGFPRTIRLAFYFLVGLVLGASVTLAHAGYALPSPPPGFTASAGSYFYKVPAAAVAVNDAFNASVVVNVAGKSVQVPAAMRFASNGGQFVANAVRLNPWLAVGAVAAFLLDAGINWDEQSGAFVVQNVDSDYSEFWNLTEPSCPVATSIFPGMECMGSQAFGAEGWHVIAREPGVSSPPYSGYEIAWNGDNAMIFRKYISTCYGGMYWSPKGCLAIDLRPANDSDWSYFDQAVVPFEVSDSVARAVPLPVQQPQLAPVTEPLSQPYLDPVTGLPYRDMVRISPAPTPESPFRVRTDPFREPVASLDPDAVPVTPTPESPVEAIPEEQPLLCEEFPDASACAKLGSGIDPGSVAVQDVDVNTIQPVSIGATGGSCPADRSMQTQFGTLVFEWSTLCAFAEGVRPVILAMAWLVAGFGFFYGAKRSQ